MWRDLSHAARRLARSPGFAALAALTLSLGIGVNAALFSVLDALIIRPLPYADADRVVLLSAPGQAFVRFTLRGFELWPPELDQASVFSRTGLYAVGGLNLGGQPSERVQAAEVTPGFFEALGVRTELGRAFTETDLRQTPQVVVIGHRLWRRRFAADPAIVGRSLILNDRPFVVAGVLPPRADFPGAAELWVPTGTADSLGASVQMPRVVARLAPGVTPVQARGHVLRVTKTAVRTPQTEAMVTATPLREALVGNVRPVLVLVAAAAFLVLLVACTNAASLLLARVAAREREFAVRRALGASRSQLVRQVLCESLLLSMAAGILAVPGARATLDLARTFLPPTLHGATEIGLDGRTFAALGALSLLTALLFGLAPAASIPGRSSSDILRGGSGVSLDRFWRRFRSGLAVAEIALALVLLAGAVTIVKTVRELLAADLGVRGTNALAIDAVLPLATYGSPESVQRFYERLDAELRALPGIEDVGATNELPGGGSGALGALRIASMERPEEAGGGAHALELCASPGYFAALGIDLLAGRMFNTFDRPGSSKVAIVSVDYAKALGLSPHEILGRHVNVASMMQAASWAEVVGVVRDVRMFGPESKFTAGIYAPFAQAPPVYGTLHIVVRSKTDPRHLIPAIRAAAARVDGNLPLYNIRTFDEVRAAYLAERRFAMALMLIFGGLAFALAFLGLYGVINYLVQIRTREIGVRIAIGATSAAVRREVLASGARHGSAGIAIGLLATFASWQLFSANVPQLGRLDPMALGVLAIALVTLTVAASWVPAWRATSVDPVQALRCD